MPSKSEKQAKTMRAAAHDDKFAKKVGIPKKVAQDFVAADEGTNASEDPALAAARDAITKTPQAAGKGGPKGNVRR